MLSPDSPSSGASPDRDAALWRQLSSRYERLVSRIVPQAESFFATCVSFIPPGPIRMLELGSGTGYATERVLRHNPRAQITGLDFSRDMIEGARAKRALKQVRFVEGDIRNEWPEGPFDVIFTTLCLHHLAPAERRAVLLKARVNLRRSGRFINGDIFKPATSWEETLIRRRWLASLRSNGLSTGEAREMLAKRRRNMRCFDTLDTHRADLQAAGFRRVVGPWVCEMAAILVGWR